MVPHEARSMSYVQVPNWLKKYEPCRAPMVPTACYFPTLLCVLIDKSGGWQTLYCATLTDHSVMVLTMILRHDHCAEDIIKLNIPSFDPRMWESVYKDVLFLLQDAVARFLLVAGVDHIVAQTRYSPVIAHKAVLRSSKIDWANPDCMGWYSYDYRSGNVREVLSTDCGGRVYPESMPQASEGVKVVNSFVVRAIFDEKDRAAKAQLKKVHNSSPGKPSQAGAVVGKR